MECSNTCRHQKRNRKTKMAHRLSTELITGEKIKSFKTGRSKPSAGGHQKESDEKAKLELAIIENLQREDLNAIDRAMAFGKLVNDFKLKHHEVATPIGKSREYVNRTIRLLMLPEEIQNAFSERPK